MSSEHWAQLMVILMPKVKAMVTLKGLLRERCLPIQKQTGKDWQTETNLPTGTNLATLMGLSLQKATMRQMEKETVKHWNWAKPMMMDLTRQTEKEMDFAMLKVKERHSVKVSDSVKAMLKVKDSGLYWQTDFYLLTVKG